uniref:DDE Tnp4 domain-containing protein n=1 Tax=Biomphalaria glabrata TaxID=6526 RepID=A0A2C9K5B8_BIOGL
MFQISITSVFSIFNKLVSLLYDKAKSVNIWPSREQIKAFMPPVFQKTFPTCRVIIDTTEFYIHKPINPTSQQASFSTYKNHNTLKSLIGIAPNGAISFISDLWMGSISDKEITLRSGILELLEEGDTVLADRGFTVLEPEFQKRKLSLFTPFFLKNKIQFPIDERSENKKVSSHRCHVERAIGRIKNYKILDKTIPCSLKNIEEIYFVCVFLCNFTENLLMFK